MRSIEKRYILPAKWWFKKSIDARKKHLADIKQVEEKKSEMEKLYHEQIRKNLVNESNTTKGFIQALEWICQELNEYKT